MFWSLILRVSVISRTLFSIEIIKFFFPDIKVSSHDTLYSHRKQLHWTSVTNGSSGKYICKANVIKFDSIEEKEWWLDIIQPQTPLLDTSNLNETSKHSLGEPLVLNCKFLGIPRPNIRWYRDDVEIIEDENDSRISFHDNKTILDIKYIKIEDQGKYKCAASNRLGDAARETTLKITSNKKVVIR